MGGERSVWFVPAGSAAVCIALPSLVVLLLWYQQGSAWSLGFPVLSPSLQSDIRGVYRSFVSKLDRKSSGLSAASVDIKAPELGSTVADVVSNNHDPCVFWGRDEFHCYSGRNYLLLYWGHLPWGQVKAACYLGSGSRVYCLLTSVSAFSPSWQI